MYKMKLSNHSQKGRFLPTIFDFVKNKENEKPDSIQYQIKSSFDSVLCGLMNDKT